MANLFTTLFPSYHTARCVHWPGPTLTKVCEMTSSPGNALHLQCPACGAKPDFNAGPCHHTGPSSGLQHLGIICHIGGTEHEARLTLRDPENIDHYIEPHEYAVCDVCHKKQDELKATGQTSVLAGQLAGKASAAATE